MTLTVELRLVKNGSEVAGSQMYQQIQQNNSVQSITGEILSSITSGDTIKVQLTGSKTSSQVLAGSGNATTKPSIKMRIIRIT